VGIFNWVNTSTFATYNDYQFFSEVIFGINSPDRYSRAVDWYNGTELGISYLVDYNNLMGNILGYGESAILSNVLDIRSKQWKTSNAMPDALGYSLDGTYLSNRYTLTYREDRTAYNNFQPLMRLSEMYYIQAETALKNDKEEAIRLLNTVLQNRGLTVQYYLPADISEADIRLHIEKEYYREFFGEGQVFFFHKRLKSARMFKGNTSGYDEDISGDSYVVPIPQDETDI
jgi:hypothetical protein